MYTKRSIGLRQFAAGTVVLLLISGATAGQAQGPKPKPQGGEPAQATTSAGPAGVTPAKEAEIRKLLELTGAKKNALAFGQQLSQYLRGMMEKSLPPGGEHNKQIEDTLISKLMDRMGSDELIVKLIPIYDKAFSDDDLKGINRFYESPVGRKFLEQTPAVMEEASSASQTWIQQMIPEIIGQMSEQFPELKDKAAPGPQGTAQPAK
jgi:hypothetical protein